MLIRRLPTNLLMALAIISMSVTALSARTQQAVNTVAGRSPTDPTSVASTRVRPTQPLPPSALHRLHTGFWAVWARDGRKIILSSNLSGRLNFWSQSLQGGSAKQLTTSEERQLYPVMSADGSHLYFQTDHGGGEIFDLQTLDLATNAVEPLTRTEDTSESDVVPAPDGKTIAFSVRGRADGFTNLAVMTLADRSTRLLTNEAAESSLIWTACAFSRDGKTLIANHYDVGKNRSAIYAIDLASGNRKVLTADDGKAFNFASDLSPDGKTLALTMQTSEGDRQAAIIGADGQIKLVKPDGWEQRAGRFSPDGKAFVAVSNRDGRDAVFLYALDTRQVMHLALPIGSNVDLFGSPPWFSPDGSKLLFTHSSSSLPQDYWIWDLKAGAARRVTQLGKLDEAKLPPAKLVHYRSRDGLLISAMLWLPDNLRRDGKTPAVVLAHGGPLGQTRDSFDLSAAMLVSHGYAVLGPNPRGSTGFGRAFMDANRRDLGGGDLQDLVAGTDFLVKTGYVDRKRIGIYGGSYGGYLTLIALGKTPDVWAAGVDMYGIVNWTTMYERGSPALRDYQRMLIGDPEKDKAIYAAVSPLSYVDRMEAPLLVLQGENDLRVPKLESEQIVARLRALNKPVDVHYYAGEGHGFSKVENEIDSLDRTLAWFDRYLRPR